MPRSLFLFALGAATCLAAPAVERTVLIVAGQSNLLNWHADATALPSHAADAHVAFFFHTGAPPSKAGQMSTPFNATSAGAWTTLRPQRQDPYVRYCRDFFGPEMSLGRTLQDDGVPPLGIVKVGYFGSSLAEDWRPDATAGNRLYALLLTQVQRAFDALAARGESARLAGIFWLQGETDGVRLDSATAYEAHLRTFLARLRQNLAYAVPGSGPVPVVLGRVGPPPARGYPHQELVRNAQVRVAESLPRTAWVDTDDLPRDTDGVHLLAPGVLSLGQRWAAAWQRLRVSSASKP
jgi:hypothetical protein